MDVTCRACRQNAPWKLKRGPEQSIDTSHAGDGPDYATPETNGHREIKRVRIEPCANLAHVGAHPDILTMRSRSALPMTEIELRLIAPAAIMGESSKPKTGYSAPAAIGMPMAL